MSDFTVGLRIRELREARCYSRNDFAEMVDISPKFLYEIETGKKGFFCGCIVSDCQSTVS